jgi:hypothetical protein
LFDNETIAFNSMHFYYVAVNIMILASVLGYQNPLVKYLGRAAVTSSNIFHYSTSLRCDKVASELDPSIRAKDVEVPLDK